MLVDLNRCTVFMYTVFMYSISILCKIQALFLIDVKLIMKKLIKIVTTLDESNV